LKNICDNNVKGNWEIKRTKKFTWLLYKVFTTKTPRLRHVSNIFAVVVVSHTWEYINMCIKLWLKYINLVKILLKSFVVLVLVQYSIVILCKFRFQAHKLLRRRECLQYCTNIKTTKNFYKILTYFFHLYIKLYANVDEPSLRIIHKKSRNIWKP
jgi:hypothetical protein